MAYLKQQTNEATKIYTCATLAYDRNIDLYETGTGQGLKRLQSFFDIGEVESFENDKFLAKNHILHFSPDTQRCVFLDPLSSNCLIYPARPLTCRMFPYDVKDSAIFMVNETDECPGVGHGERVNIRRLHRLSKMCEKLLCIDESLFWEFVQCEGLRKTDLRADYAESINIIDPFIQLGLIPSLR